MLSLDPAVDLSQAVDQFLLFVLFPKDRGHLFLQRTDNVGVNLCTSEGEAKREVTLDTSVQAHTSSTVLQ